MEYFFDDDVIDTTKNLDRNFVIKNYKYVKPKQNSFSNDITYENDYFFKNYHPENLYRSNNCANTESGLCIFGSDRQNVQPPYQFTEYKLNGPRNENIFIPVSRRNLEGKYVKNMNDVNLNEMSVFQNRPSTRKFREVRPAPEYYQTLHGWRRNDIKNYIINDEINEKILMSNLLANAY